MEKNETASAPTAFLVDLVSNRKIPVATPRCRVGRDDLNDIVISGDQSISRFHFIITYEDGGYRVQDAKSRHGTFLNGNQLDTPEPINDGDVLKVGVSLFWFVVETAAGAAKESKPASPEGEVPDTEISIKAGSAVEMTKSVDQGSTQEIDKESAAKLLAEHEANEAKAKEEAEKAEAEKVEADEAQADKAEPAEEKKEENEEEKAAADAGDEAKESSAEATGEAEPAEGLRKVSDLLNLEEELEASREMIRDALKKGELDSESGLPKEDGAEPAKDAAAEEKGEDAPPESEKSEDGKEESQPESQDKDKEEESPKSESESTRAGEPEKAEAETATDSEPASDKEESDKEESEKETEAASESTESTPEVSSESKPEDSKDEAPVAESDPAAAEPEPTSTEPEATSTEPEATSTEPEATSTESETTSVEPEASSAESEASSAESEASSAEQEATSSEPEATSTSEPEASSTESQETSSEPQSELEETSSEPEATSTEPEESESPTSESLSSEISSEIETNGSEPPSKSDSSDSETESAETQEPADQDNEGSEVSAEEQLEEPSDKKEENGEVSDEKLSEAETAEKIAEIIEGSSAGDGESASENVHDERASLLESMASSQEVASESNATVVIRSKDIDLTTVKHMGPTSVPDWCKKYFSDELKSLHNELESLNERIRQTQEQISNIESQAALTRGLRNTLLTSEGDDLVEACQKVAALAGWKVTPSKDDKKELALERDGEHMALARIVWTRESVERAHLGQLHTALTRYWCETGVEPKGILIISKLRDNGPSESLHDNADKELVEFAKQKNICLLTTVQLLAVYREVALKAGEGSKQRNIILNASGWLEGLDLRPGEEILESEEGGKGKSLSSLLSA